MKYFFISDLHGCEPGLVDIALQAKNFDKKRDTLVVLGDVVDRGGFSRQLLEYLTTFPNLITVYGNHDVRLQDLLQGGDYPTQYDKSNGVGSTLASFLGYKPQSCKPNQLFNTWMRIQYSEWPDIYSRSVALFNEYMRNSVWCIEFPDLIATHGWLPSDKRGLIPLSSADIFDWEDATWAHTESCIDEKMFPEKRLIIGHWGTWLLRAKYTCHMSVDEYLKDRSKVDFTIFETPQYIAIDGTVTFSNIVNVYVYESDAEPIVYTKKGSMPITQWRSYQCR